MKIIAFAILGVLAGPSALAAEQVLSRPNTGSPNTALGHKDLQERYDAMWRDYKTAVDQIADDVDEFIDEQKKPAVEAGDLELSLFWENLRKQYVSDGRLNWDEKNEKKNWRKKYGKTPFPNTVEDFVSKKSNALYSARRVLADEYADLVTELTKQDDTDAAAKLRDEAKSVWEGRHVAGSRVAQVPQHEQNVKVQKGPKDGRYRFNFTNQEGGLLLEVKDGKLWIHGDILKPTPQFPNGVSLWPNPFLQKWQGQEDFKFEGGKLMTDIPGWSLTWDLDTGEATRYLKNSKKAQVGKVVPGGW